MDSLTNRFTKLDMDQEDLSSHLENLRRWVKSDPDEAFAARPGVKSVDKWGGTAIHWALSEDEGSVELLTNLLDRKAATNIPDLYGFYAVHKAAEVGSVEQLQLLKRAGAPMCVGQDAWLEAHDQHGWLGATALHLAVRDGHLEVLKLFLAFGVDPCARMWDDSTALHITADHIHPEGPGEPEDYEGLVKGLELCLKLLLDRAPKSVGMRDNLGRTPFHRALATMAPYEIRRIFFEVHAPLGRQIGKSCYVASVKLEYYHGRHQWQHDECKEYDLQSSSALVQDLHDEGIQVTVQGDSISVEVNHQLWTPRRARG